MGARVVRETGAVYSLASVFSQATASVVTPRPSGNGATTQKNTLPSWCKFPWCEKPVEIPSRGGTELDASCQNYDVDKNGKRKQKTFGSLQRFGKRDRRLLGLVHECGRINFRRARQSAKTRRSRLGSTPLVPFKYFWLPSCRS